MKSRYTVEYNDKHSCYMIMDKNTGNFLRSEAFIYESDARKQCGILNDKWREEAKKPYLPSNNGVYNENWLYPGTKDVDDTEYMQGIRFPRRVVF